MSVANRRSAAAAELFRPVALENDVLANLDSKVSFRQLPLDEVQPNPEQPRRSVDEGAEPFEFLVGTIRQRGLLQPIVVEPLDAGGFRIVAGERRWRAFRRLREENPRKYGAIAAVIRQPGREVPDADILVDALTENIAREDLSDIEKASAVARLRIQHGFTADQIAGRMGVHVARIYELEKLGRHEAVRAAAVEGVINQRQAIVLGRLEDEQLAEALIPAVGGLDRAQTAAVVQTAKLADAELPAEERAVIGRSAGLRGRPEVGPPPSAVRTVEMPLTYGEQELGRIRRDTIILTNTPFAVMKPRLREISRDHLAGLMQAAAEELDIWPVRSE